MIKESIFCAPVAFITAIVLSLFPAQSGYAQKGHEEKGGPSSSPKVGAPHDIVALPTTTGEVHRPHEYTAHRLLFSTNDETAVFPPDPLPLNWCLERAQQSSPSIAVDEAAAAAAAHRVSPAGALEDPRFSYEATNIPVGDFDFNSTPMSGNQLRLMQKFPFPGVLSNRKEAARAGASAATEDLEDQRLRVAAVVESRWAELGFAQRALEITDANIELLRQLNEIAEVKYSLGSGLQQDVLRAQVELTRLLEERLRRIEALAAAEAQLAAVLDLPPPTLFPQTAGLRDESPLPEIAPLLSRLDDTSPLLHALAERVEEAERLHRATEFEGYPDFDLGVGYRIRQRAFSDPVAGDDFVSAGVTLRLPVNRGKWREKTAERAALVRRAEAVYRDGRARLRDAVRTTFAALERADAEVALLETGLVPQTRQSLDSSRSGYQVDKVDFLSLIDSQVRLLDAELSLVRAVADRRAAFAALESAIGKELR
ncbi:MAG: TolC family protein [Myxococcales bacterium]|nr:TolC family protein [Myxococcales bacterium]